MTLDRPAYVGMCILDLSKTLLYDFHYNTIKEMYGDNAKLLFTDTDSVCHEIKAKDAYKDLWAKKDLFDLSDYTKDSPYFDPTNKKVPGKFKDECAGKPMGGFIYLKSKRYSYLMDDGKDNKTCKVLNKTLWERILGRGRTTGMII